MSTLTVTNIKATGETASRAVSGVAAAWVNFNGTGTIAIRDSNGNVSGLVDNGTGDYTVSFVNSFDAANYVSSQNVGASSTNNNPYQAKPHHSGWSTSSTRVYTVYTDASVVNVFEPPYILYVIHGDLA